MSDGYFNMINHSILFKVFKENGSYFLMMCLLTCFFLTFYQGFIYNLFLVFCQWKWQNFITIYRN